MTYLDAEGDGPMKHDHDDDSDLPEDSDRLDESRALGGNPFDRPRGQFPAPDPHDDGLDDSFADDGWDDYEEPERDTVQSGGSTEMYYEEEDEGIDDLFTEDPPFEEDDDPDDGPTLSLVPEQPPGASTAADDEEREPRNELEEWPTTGAAASIAATRWQNDADDDTDDDWQDHEEFLDDDNSGPAWPYGLIAVAVLALVLLVAGGYGVMQQRQATEEEILQLRAELATAASPDGSSSRQALQAMKAENVALARQVEALTRDNRRLADTVAGLEAQLDAQQAVLGRARPEAPAAAPEAAAPQPSQPSASAQPASSPAPAAAPITTGTATAAPTGSWFVNFGSYAREDIAREWAGRLDPDNGEAVLVSAEVNGKTLYRVRVVGIDNPDTAERIARQLEAAYSLPRLWVGKQ